MADMLDVTSMLRPERAALVELLSSLEPDDWDRRTECPAYSVKGVATHVLGDDVSLLSRQRDQATNGLLLVAEDMAGADFRTSGRRPPFTSSAAGCSWAGSASSPRSTISTAGRRTASCSGWFTA